LVKIYKNRGGATGVLYNFNRTLGVGDNRWKSQRHLKFIFQDITLNWDQQEGHHSTRETLHSQTLCTQGRGRERGARLKTCTTWKREEGGVYIFFHSYCVNGQKKEFDKK